MRASAITILKSSSIKKTLSVFSINNFQSMYFKKNSN